MLKLNANIKELRIETECFKAIVLYDKTSHI